MLNTQRWIIGWITKEMSKQIIRFKKIITEYVLWSTVQFSCLVASDSWDSMGCSTPGLPVNLSLLWSLLKLMSIESVMPSNHLILCHPLLLPSIFPSIRVFSKESVLCIRWPKDWSFSFSISPSNEYSELISFRMDWLDLLGIQGTLKSLLQHHSSKASVLRYSAFFFFSFSFFFIKFLFLLYFTLQYCIGFPIHWHESTMCVHAIPRIQLSHPYMTTRKNHSFDETDFCW